MTRSEMLCKELGIEMGELLDRTVGLAKFLHYFKKETGDNVNLVHLKAVLGGEKKQEKA